MTAACNRIYHGEFGRVVLLRMTQPLITHAHPQHHILCKIAGADGAMNVGGRVYPLDSNSIVLINAWEPHYYMGTGSDPALLMAFYIEPAWLAEVQPSIPSLPPRLSFERHCIERTADLDRFISRFASYMLHDDTLEQDTLENIVGALAIRATALSVSGTGHARASDFRIRRSIRHIQDNPCAHLETAELASISGLSTPHFFELFKQCTGLTPRNYINVIRMEAALSNLSCRTLRMIELSDILGFNAQSHFTRFFRSHVGITPSQYSRVLQSV